MPSVTGGALHRGPGAYLRLRPGFSWFHLHAGRCWEPRADGPQGRAATAGAGRGNGAGGAGTQQAVVSTTAGSPVASCSSACCSSVLRPGVWGQVLGRGEACHGYAVPASLRQPGTKTPSQARAGLSREELLELLWVQLTPWRPHWSPYVATVGKH